MTAKEQLNKTNVTSSLIEIWKQILHVDQVTINDDFIRLGGHSLNAIKLLNSIRKEFEIDIPIDKFLEEPTIQAILRIINSNGSKHDKNEARISLSHSSELQKLPLTNTQRRIWISTFMDNKNPSFNVPFTLILNGTIDIELFEKTIEIIFHRHHTMFSTFGVENDEPYIQINNTIPILINFIDLSSESKYNKATKVKDILGQDARNVFDLEKGPLYRVSLIKTSDVEYYFRLNVHHIIFDGISQNLFIQEFSQVYNDLSHNREVNLPELAHQQYDLGIWEQENKNRKDLSTEINYWRNYLNNIPSLINFPLDYPRLPYSTGIGQKEEINISEQLTKRLQELSSKEGVSLFTVVFSSLALLINKYSHDLDFCIGIPVSQRPVKELESVFGMFINTLPIRFKLESVSSFTELLHYTKINVRNGLKHQELPFENIVENANIERDLKYTPLYQIQFSWLNPEDSILINTDGFTGRRAYMNEVVSETDITFYMWECEGEIQGEIDYNCHIFDKETINQLKHNFIALLNEILIDVDRPLVNISPMSDLSQMTLNNYNNTEVKQPNKLLHELVEDMVKKFPYKEAVVAGKTRLTYQEINNRANELAQTLINKNVKGFFVGISMPRNELVPISILAILKAGANYLPLDPEFPEDRLKYILDDSETKLLICTKELQPKFQDLNTEILIIQNSTTNLNPEQQSFKNPNLKISHEDLAYTIYTSGTTGNPKGVKVPHRAISNLMRSIARTHFITSEDKLLSVITLSFDMSVFELFVPLTSGASIVFANSKQVNNGIELIKIIKNEKVTFIQATPSTWNLLLLNGWEGDKRFKAVSGGEAMPPKLVNDLLPKVGKLMNIYGPTETTIYSTFFEVTDPSAPMMVGKPVNNTKIYILDKFNHVLPPGIFGEVCIGGMGVSQGYHNREELTKQKFIHINNIDTIIYKTGDSGRIRASGQLELAGRIDNQIKLRGYRIEPGEIETVIGAWTGINEVVVKLQNFDEMDDRLIAFIVMDNGVELDGTSLKLHLSSILPNYMVPSAVVELKEIPKTHNGKTDRNKLIYKPEKSIKRAHKAISTKDTQLIKIWEEILKVNNIEPSDDFFSLGGHSLLAFKLINRINEEFKKSISIRDFLSGPTVEQIGFLLKKKNILKAKVDSNQLSSLKRNTDLPLTPTQTRIWFTSKLLNNPSYNISFTLKIEGKLDETVFIDALSALFDRHKILYATFKDIDSSPFYDIIKPKDFPINLINLENNSVIHPEKEIEDILVNDVRKVFDLDKSPLFRIYLIKIDRVTHFFHITVHHVIFDGLSIGIFWKDFNSLYNSILNNSNSSLPEIEFHQYDYAEWNSQRYDKNLAQKSYQYWKKQLKGVPSKTNFPYDYPRLPYNSGFGENETFTIPNKMSQDILSLCKKEDITPFHMFLSAFALHIKNYTGESDFCIGTAVSNRSHGLIEDIIGMFADTLILRFNTDKIHDFKDLIRFTKSTVINGISHLDIPYNEIVDIVKPERSINYNPLFQIAFVWQENQKPFFESDGIKCSKVNLPKGITPFDITFNMWDNAGQIQGEIEYNCDILNRETIQLFKENFIALLPHVLEDIKKPLNGFVPISANSQTILDEYNNTAVSYAHKPLHHFFEEMVIKHPNKEAVVAGSIKLSYNELNNEANKLAHLLIKNKVKGTCIGVSMPRNEQMLIAILAIQKAGAVYIHLTHDSPNDQMQFILKDTGVKLILTTNEIKYVFNNADAKILTPKTSKFNFKLFRKTYKNPGITIEPYDYIFTFYKVELSGDPLKVKVPQQAVVNLINSIIEIIGITPNDRLLAANYSVSEISVIELMLPLSIGATVFIANNDEINDSLRITNRIKDYNINLLLSTTNIWKLLLQSGWEGNKNLRAIHVKDLLPSTLLKDLLPLVGRLWSTYGPTETTLISAYHEISDAHSNLVAGKPFPNTQIYIVDKFNHILPPGIFGNICIRSIGNTIASDTKTELIKKNTITIENNITIYKTSDVGRILSNGVLELKGKNDPDSYTQEIYKNSTDYWKNYLNGVPSLTEFPYDYPKKGNAQVLVKSSHFSIPPKQLKEIFYLCKNEDLSPYQFFLSAFAVLIKNYSHEKDFWIGTACTQINENLMNYNATSNPFFVLRFNTEEIKTFYDLVSHTKKEVENGLNHLDISIKEILNLDNNNFRNNQNTVFQIAFLWKDKSNANHNSESLENETETSNLEEIPFDFTLNMWNDNGHIEGLIEYNQDILRDTTVNRFVDNFIHLVGNLCSGYTKPLDSISYVNDHELKLISSFNGVKTKYPNNTSVVALFQDQVKLQPDNIALKYKHETLTYGELNFKSNQLARTILKNNPAKNEHIGLLCNKSSELIVAILAILKSNCCYVPIDPEYPMDRIDQILKDSECKLLLIQKEFKKLVRHECICINLNSQSSFDNINTDLSTDIQPNDLAYIMYTSGTTGQPKGSLICHKSIIRLVKNTNYISLNEKDRILLTGSIVFDASTFEIWGALLNGGQLHIVDKKTILSPDIIGKEIKANSITTLWLTSPLFTVLSEIDPYIFEPLKNLLVGGDVLSVSHINRIRKLFPGLGIINGYGPTENTTFSTCYTIEREFESNIPIGKPISNSTAYILDENLHPVPIGVTGELFVGGDGLSQGYLNRPKLNEEKFLLHPEYGYERLYKTGDHASWLPDGNIRFHGRIDNQLKIRGFRVELGEIESILLKHNNIVETALKTYTESQDDIKIVAFIRVKSEREGVIEEIQNELKTKLPPYMLPEKYVILDELPKTINGKIDKKKLVLDQLVIDAPISEEEPLTPSQKKILQIWESVLNNKSIKLNDSFFEVGGNSLLAVAIVNKIEKKFKYKLELIHFFENPTIKNIDEKISSK